MARSRIADTYVDIAPTLNEGFTRDLQKAMNAAMRALTYDQLSKGVRQEGSQAGRHYKTAFENAADNPRVRHDFNRARREAIAGGRKTGKGFKDGVESGAKNPQISIRGAVTEATTDAVTAGRTGGRRVGRAIESGIENAVDPDIVIDLSFFDKMQSYARTTAGKVGAAAEEMSDDLMTLSAEVKTLGAAPAAPILMTLGAAKKAATTTARATAAAATTAAATIADEMGDAATEAQTVLRRFETTAEGSFDAASMSAENAATTARTAFGGIFDPLKQGAGYNFNDIEIDAVSAARTAHSAWNTVLDPYVLSRYSFDPIKIDAVSAARTARTEFDGIFDPLRQGAGHNFNPIAVDAVSAARTARTAFDGVFDPLRQGAGHNFNPIAVDAVSAARTARTAFNGVFDPLRQGAGWNFNPIVVDARTAATAANSAFGQTFAGLTADATSTGQQAGRNWVEAFTGASASLRDNMGGLIGGATVGAGVTFGTAGAANMDDAAVRIAASVGKNNDVYQAAAKNGLKHGMSRGFELEDVTMATGAIAAWKPSLLLQQKEVNDLIDRLLFMNKVFEVDTPAAMRVAGSMVTNGLSKDIMTALGELSVGMQNTKPELRAEMMDLIGEYGVHAAGAGMTGQNLVEMLVKQGEVGNGQGMDYAADAVKEMKNLVGDTQNVAATEALQEMGLNHKKLATAMLEGGQASREAYDIIYRSLLAVKDPAEQARLSLALMGSPAEELGRTQGGLNRYLETRVQQNEGYGDVNAQTTQATQEALQTTRQMWDSMVGTFKVTFEEIFEPLVRDVLPVLQMMVTYMKENKEEVQGWIKAAGVLAVALTFLMSLGFIGWVAAGIAQIGPMIVAMKTAAAAAWAWAAGIGAVGLATGAAMIALTILVAGVGVLMVALMADWDKTIAWLRDSAGPLGDIFANAAEGWRFGLPVVLDELGKILHDFFGGLEGFGGDVMAVIGNVVISVVNKVIDGINVLRRAWSGFSMALGGQDIGEIKHIAPILPKMATGGDVMGATALIAGEKEPETIVNRGVMNEALQKMINRLDGETGKTPNGTTIHNKIDIHQLPGESSDELVRKIVEQMAWEKGRQ